ncbi:phage tail tube protein [Frankia sp. Cj3]|uniref:phage tail tube protein n=1 Tax=Frankia sp. Cj3 TaxID=2880976 RepID=UPI002103E00A|nr:phage tail tube protein [Frankia sp. Cj3]
MPAYGSGLSAQIGFAAETTVGTAVTVTTFFELLDESIKWEPTWLESAGLKAGQGYKRVSRISQSRFSVSGDWTLEHADRGHMGLLWRHALGSAITTPTQIASTTAYKQIHTPGSKTGLSLTGQVGRPQPNATVRPFTYRGLKTKSWEFSVSDGEIAKLKLSLDGWQMATGTALATASYSAAAGVFNFANATNFKIGGTVATASGETTISGGTAVTTLAKGVTIKGETPMAAERFGLGNAGVKGEQIENGIPMISGDLDAEFTDRTEFYDLFVSNTTTALQLDFSQGDAGGSNPFLLSFIFPAIKIKGGDVNVGGPDIVGQKISFEAYDNGTDPVMQVKIVSTDTTL